MTRGVNPRWLRPYESYISKDGRFLDGNCHSSHLSSNKPSSSDGVASSELLPELGVLEQVKVVWRENESCGVKVEKTVSKFGNTLYGLLIS